MLVLGGGLLLPSAASGLLSACGASPPPLATGTPSARPAPTATSAPAPSGRTVVRAAFVYSGSINDRGRTNAHDDGRKALDTALGSSVETAYTENVPETADAQRVFEDYAHKGYTIIYGTSYGFMDSMLEAARSFPDVKFDHCSGFKTLPNMATYAAAEEEPRYVSGMIAGKLTRTNTLGFVGAIPTPEVVRYLNGFAAGVLATNPAARIHVVWIGTWFDPLQEKAAAESMLDLNADVLTGTADSPALAQAATGRGKLAVGVDYDQSTYGTPTVVQSDRFVWGPHYIDSVKSLLNGSWQPLQRYYHMKDGLVEATPPADVVPADVAAAAMNVASQMKAGTFNMWQGPVTDNHGNVRAPAGTTLGDFLDPNTTPHPGQSRDDAYVQSNQMNWALSNVLGDIRSGAIGNPQERH